MICYVLAMGKQHLGPYVVVGYGIKMFWPGLFITSPDHLDVNDQPRTRQTCLSKTFANSPNKQKLSKQVLVIIWHCLGNSQINSIPAWSKETFL